MSHGTPNPTSNEQQGWAAADPMNPDHVASEAMSPPASDNAGFLSAPQSPDHPFEAQQEVLDTPPSPEVPGVLAASAPQQNENTTAAAVKPSHTLQGLMATVQSLCLTIAIAVFVITFVVQAFQIPSESMETTLLIGDYLLVDKVKYGNEGMWGRIEPYQPIRRGDIIVFRYPVNPQQHFVKRVIGVPGDRIRMSRKRLFINGQLQKEPYAVFQSPGFDQYRDNFPNPRYIDPNVDVKWWARLRRLIDGDELIVPENSYFVLGDNRDKSLDSRYWGFVPRENVIGRPLLIYFSMRKPISVSTPLASFSDKLHEFTYNLSDLSGRIRWNRTFRLIK